MAKNLSNFRLRLQMIFYVRSICIDSVRLFPRGAEANAGCHVLLLLFGGAGDWRGSSSQGPAQGDFGGLFGGYRYIAAAF